MILLMLSLQAGAPPPAPAAPAAAAAEADEAAAQPILRSDFDLERVAPRPDEIVVTARRRDQRLPPLPEAREEGPPRAETGLIGQVRGSVETEAAGLGGGVVSKRAMVRVKIPF